MVFDEGFEIDSILAAIHNPKIRRAWDKDIDVAEVLSSPKQNFILWYQKNKSAVKIVSQRDFVEKKLKFKKDNKVYVYFSSIPDEFKEIEKSTERAYTVAGFH